MTAPRVMVCVYCHARMPWTSANFPDRNIARCVACFDDFLARPSATPKLRPVKRMRRRLPGFYRKATG